MQLRRHILIASLLLPAAVFAAEPQTGTGENDGYRLVWQDLFDADALSPERWEIEVNGACHWGQGWPAASHANSIVNPYSLQDG